MSNHSSYFLPMSVHQGSGITRGNSLSNFNNDVMSIIIKMTSIFIFNFLLANFL